MDGLGQGWMDRLDSNVQNDPGNTQSYMDRVGLPRWLAHPLVIPFNSSEISVDPADGHLFESLDIEGLFPFQQRIRELLRSRHPEGWRDLCVSAPTGSGKTLAYTLPIVESLKDRVVGRLAALVVVPTRDLISQVEDTFLTVSKAYGRPDLKPGTDFLITTPGKLITLLPDLKLEGLKYLVVDEADRLLDQSFQEWLPLLLAHLGTAKTQTTSELFDSDAWQGESDSFVVKKLLFSATLTTNPAKIAPLALYRPLYLTVRPADAENDVASVSALVTPETLEERVAVFNGSEELKPAVLMEILTEILPKILGGVSSPVLCFTKSVSSAQRLARLLSLACPSLQCAAFHGNLSDSDRSKILAACDSGSLQVLVGSDAMARGLDLKSVLCVINYDVPMFAATYVHRVGRTARAGQKGLALTLLPSAQMRHFKQMTRSALNKTIVDCCASGQPLKWNEIGKMEIDEETIREKWRLKLGESLKELREQQRK